MSWDAGSENAPRRRVSSIAVARRMEQTISGGASSKSDEELSISVTESRRRPREAISSK